MHLRSQRALVLLACLVLAPAGGTAQGTAAAASGPEQCAAAARLVEAGELGAARAGYLAAATASDGGCAQAGLTQLRRTRAAALCDRASALDDAHQSAEAKAAYRSSLALEPKGCAASPLADDPGPLERVGNALEGALPWIPVTALILWLAVALAAWEPAWHAWIARQPPWRWLLQEQLRVASLGDTGLEPKVGAALGALTQGQLWQQDHGGSLDFVSAHEGLADVLGDLKGLDTKTQAVGTLLGVVDRLLPTRRLTIGGELLPCGRRGGGVVCTFHDRSMLKASVELWTQGSGAEPVPANTAPSLREYIDLCVGITAWACMQLYRDRDAQPVSTRDAISHAYTASGIAALELDEPDRARYLLEDAIEADGANWAAIGNLGRAEALLGNHWAATHLLEQALELIWGSAEQWVLEHQPAGSAAADDDEPTDALALAEAEVDPVG